MNRILFHALQQANMEVSQGGGAPLINPGAMSPEALEAMAGKNTPVPAGKNWTEAGTTIAQTIIAAEQGITIAEQTLSATKLSGLMELAKHQDDVERSQMIAGCQSAFATVDGDRLKKQHQNYMADLRRVSGSIKNNGIENTVKMLAEPGDYAARIARIPKQSNAGGNNTGRASQKEVVAAALNAAKEVGAAQVIEALAAAPAGEKVVDTVGKVGHEVVDETKPEGTKVPQRHSQAVEFTTEQACSMMDKLSEDQLEAVGAAYAKRLLRSASPLFVNLGTSILKVLDNESIQDAIEQAASITAKAA